MATGSSIDDLDDNQFDFDLLRRVSDGPAPLQSSRTNFEDGIWPLQLHTFNVDHYTLGDSIGSGSYAEVREAIDTRTLNRCAIKVVNKAYLARQAPEVLRNQLQEIRLLRRLDHPNVITLRECISKGSKIYIVMEHCMFQLEDILSELPGRRLREPMSRNLFVQLIQGLSYLHASGVVHRDIKPHNLLITNSGLLKIIDFGVSSFLSIWAREDTCSSYEGSPLFQAPEVVVGQSSYGGFKADVWSAGVTLYLMLYGEYPFRDDSLLNLYDQILGKEFNIPRIHDDPVLESHSTILADLLSFMLKKSASERATCSDVLRHPWTKLACGRDCYEHADFVDDRIKHYMPQSNSPYRDIYRSMTVLPYLYKIHFPNLPVTKHDKPVMDPVKLAVAVKLRPQSLNDSSNHGPEGKPNNPHSFIDEEHVEWGNETQYRLMKVPSVRANRIRRASRELAREAILAAEHRRPSSI